MVDRKIRNSIQWWIQNKIKCKQTIIIRIFGLLTKRRDYYRNTLQFSRIYSLCHHRTNIRKGFVVKAKKVEDDETQRRNTTKRERERDQRRSFPRKKRTKLSIPSRSLIISTSRKIFGSQDSIFFGVSEGKPLNCSISLDPRKGFLFTEGRRRFVLLQKSLLV